MILYWFDFTELKKYFPDTESMFITGAVDTIGTVFDFR